MILLPLLLRTKVIIRSAIVVPSVILVLFRHLLNTFRQTAHQLEFAKWLFYVKTFAVYGNRIGWLRLFNYSASFANETICVI